jgi:hypothetical protein
MGETCLVVYSEERSDELPGHSKKDRSLAEPVPSGRGDSKQ